MRSPARPVCFFSPFNHNEVSQAGYAKGNVVLTCARDNGLTGLLWVRNATNRLTVSASQ